MNKQELTGYILLHFCKKMKLSLYYIEISTRRDFYIIDVFLLTM